MRLFLDTSVLATCGSASGAAREILRLAAPNQWTLVVTPFVVEEVLRNLPQLASILFSALAWTDVLLAHDRGHFGELPGKEFYGLAIRSPGQFLIRERTAGRLKAV